LVALTIYSDEDKRPKPRNKQQKDKIGVRASWSTKEERLLHGTYKRGHRGNTCSVSDASSQKQCYGREGAELKWGTKCHAHAHILKRRRSQPKSEGGTGNRKKNARVENFHPPFLWWPQLGMPRKWLGFRSLNFKVPTGLNDGGGL